MSKLWEVVVVLALGISFELPPGTDGTGLEVHLVGPGLAVIVYGILVTVALISVLNHMPGVFALRRPLGTVSSGFEYLWGAAILAVLAQFSYTGSVGEPGRPDHRYWTLQYGSADDSWLPVMALAVFALLMWALKLRATMIEANDRLFGSDGASG